MDFKSHLSCQASTLLLLSNSVFSLKLDLQLFLKMYNMILLMNLVIYLLHSSLEIVIKWHSEIELKWFMIHWLTGISILSSSKVWEIKLQSVQITAFHKLIWIRWILKWTANLIILTIIHYTIRSVKTLRDWNKKLWRFKSSNRLPLQTFPGYLIINKRNPYRNLCQCKKVGWQVAGVS